MTVLPESLIEIREHHEPDYKPMVDYQSWRVALMNYTADLLPEKINVCKNTPSPMRSSC